MELLQVRGVQRVEIRRRRFSERPGGRATVDGDVAVSEVEPVRQERPRIDSSRPVLTLPSVRPKSDQPVRVPTKAPVEKRVDPLVVQGVPEALVKRHREMEAAFGFGLPVPLPSYAPSVTQSGDLSIDAVEDGDKGYCGLPVGLQASALSDSSGILASTRTEDIESLAWHLDQATGIVIVIGLGMGVLVRALCGKPAVTRVLVIEPDATVFQLFRISAMPYDWPGYDHKVQVIIGDPFAPAAKEVIRSEVFGRRPDYLFVSLWPEVPDAEAPSEARALVRAFDPVSAGWWGQELEMAEWLDDRGMRIDEHSVLRFFREMGVPCRPSPAYLEFCIDVAKNAGYDVAP